MVDIKYTQNFYRNDKLLETVLEEIHFNSDDLILDIGAGDGIISIELSKYSKNVISYELDPKLFSKLKISLPEGIDIKNIDFLKSKLPEGEFKVFSNIPFSITSDIVYKLTRLDSKLTVAYLFVQKDAAQRYVGIDSNNRIQNTQIATILYPRYEISIYSTLFREDFHPTPSVDIVIMKIEKREELGIEYKLYQDFITYIFNQRNGNIAKTLKPLFTYKQYIRIKDSLLHKGYSKPSQIPSQYYLELFEYFNLNGEQYKRKVIDSYIKHKRTHSKREKRTKTNVIKV